ncbi:TonB-dependent receptor [Nitrosococcus watsonii]|uniref:TonB-dependent receptor n=1 Tax=Nitrosococcus watsonii TaxID=473531 RepID=UPI000674FB09|nr:TonB-dependent receptor plug domain-containing protein [Nitrosococcus watsonii]
MKKFGAFFLEGGARFFFWNKAVYAHPVESEPPTAELDKINVTERAEDLAELAVSASQGRVSYIELDKRPLLRIGELLEVVPGMIATQHSGPGKANQYFLRGFNLDHGTDFSTNIDGIPMNLPTHAHGQGYLDLNSLIPEMVESITFQKGPYYADVGDFSSAGNARIQTFNRLSQGIAKLAVGEDDFYRGLFADSSQLGKGELLYAGEFNFYNGPWVHPNDGRRYKGLIKYTLGDSAQGLTLLGSAYHGRWNATDQIPQRAVEQGLISRLGTIDPTDGGGSSRYSLGLNWRHHRANSSTHITAYGFYYDLDLYSNFTFFLEDPLNGDQIYQKDRRWVAGTEAEHTWFLAWGDREVANTVGLQFRHDAIGEVGLFHTRAREILNTVRSDQVHQSRVSWYGESEIKWNDKFRSVVGLRGDFYNFDVNSRQPENGGDRTDFIASPKLSFILGPWAKTEYFINGGYGFHSNDARGVTTTVDPETGMPLKQVNPLVRSKGAEVGLKNWWIPGLTTTLAVWYLNLGSELVFVGDAGTTEPSGSSHRYGVELTNAYQLTSWLMLDADFAFSKAKFAGGGDVPNSLGRVISAGATMNWPTNTRFFGALRLRHYGNSPLTEEGNVKARSTTVLNLKAGYNAKQWEIMLDVLNLLNSEDPDIAYFYDSRLPGEPSSGVPDILFHPVIPRSIRGSVVVRF